MSSENAQVWWLLLLCLVALRVADARHSTSQGIIPQCAEGIDHRIFAQVLAASLKTAPADVKVIQAVGDSCISVWSLDLNVLTRIHPADRAQQASKNDYQLQPEQRLLQDSPGQISLLLAPHHGSKTSSSMPFVRHLSLDIVVFSAGRGNRYGHPHPHVVRRFSWDQSRQFNAATSGAVQWCSYQTDRVEQSRF